MTSCLDSELGLFESSLLLERGLSRNTCTAYISDLRDFGAFLAARGVASVDAITRDDIVAFLSALPNVFEPLSDIPADALRGAVAFMERAWPAHASGR